MKMKHLVAIGFGYSAERLARELAGQCWTITGTSRSEAGAAAIRAAGFNGLVFEGAAANDSAAVKAALETVTHLLVSAPPGASGCPVLAALGDRLAAAPALEWVGYFSTVGVYGDQAGGWVDEESPAEPTSERGRRRLAAERLWAEFGMATGVAASALRLPGIYGPGRSAFERIRAGDARRIIKPGQVFNRIHVDDIAGAVAHLIGAAGKSPPPIAVNITDDLPAPPEDVIAHAAGLLGVAPPPEVAFEMADLSEMARSFYSENKRVSNKLLCKGLGYRLKYPTYREGLAAILRAS